MVECMFSFPVGGGAICSGGVKIASGFGATAVCIGLAIAIVIIAVGVFFWLRRKGQAWSPGYIYATGSNLMFEY